MQVLFYAWIKQGICLYRVKHNSYMNLINSVVSCSKQNLVAWAEDILCNGAGGWLESWLIFSSYTLFFSRFCNKWKQARTHNFISCGSETAMRVKWRKYYKIHMHFFWFWKNTWDCIIFTCITKLPPPHQKGGGGPWSTTKPFQDKTWIQRHAPK